MQTITTVVVPTTTAVGLIEQKLFLRLNDDAEDSLIQEWLFAAEELFCNLTGYQLCAATLRLSLDSWQPLLYIPRLPISSITSVEYINTSNVWTTISSADYIADLSSCPGRIVFTNSAPDLHDKALPKLRVTFVAGPAVDQRLAKQAIKLLVAHWYKNRESVSTENLNDIPMGFWTIINQYKTGIVGNLNERR